MADRSRDNQDRSRSLGRHLMNVSPLDSDGQLKADARRHAGMLASDLEHWQCHPRTETLF